jgi:hypothetical protein
MRVSPREACSTSLADVLSEPRGNWSASQINVLSLSLGISVYAGNSATEFVSISTGDVKASNLLNGDSGFFSP